MNEGFITQMDSLLFCNLIFSQVNINLENLKINYFSCEEVPPLWGRCGCSGTVIHVVQKPHLEHSLL